MTNVRGYIDHLKKGKNCQLKGCQTALSAEGGMIL